MGVKRIWHAAVRWGHKCPLEGTTENCPLFITEPGEMGRGGLCCYLRPSEPRMGDEDTTRTPLSEVGGSGIFLGWQITPPKMITELLVA